MPIGPLMANVFVVGDTASREAVVIDPGQEPQAFLRRLHEEGWRVHAILVTHAHFDHIGGAADVVAATGAALYLPAAEVEWAFDPRRNLSAVLGVAGAGQVVLDRALDIRPAEAGARWTVGSAEIRALATPGHTPGGLSYHVPALGAAGAVFTGDTLFAGTVGRGDLPGGDAALLATSIREQLLTLAPDTVVLPGHGRSTTVEEERLFNPFLS